MSDSDTVKKLFDAIKDKSSPLHTLEGMGIPDTVSRVDPFLEEYMCTDGDEFLNMFDEPILDPPDAMFFSFYRRLLTAYMYDNDSRFVLDALSIGITKYPLAVGNMNQTLTTLLNRASLFRSAELINKGSSSQLRNNIDVWSLTDVLSIKYKGFIPADIGAELIKIQAQAVNSANSTNG